ncbi:MAG TPA: hypothetical protein VFH58_12650 [Acidimicrobiales bacterium]|nr:hypothetical protein [Acidimicrobiales bacterium]
MGRRSAVVVVIALLGWPAGMSGVQAASGKAPGRGPAPLVGNPVSGTASYAAGTYVWTDYVYDDRGASSSQGGDGSASYPGGLSNAADLVQLQMSEVEGGLRLRATLETLSDPSVPVLAVGFDTDRSPRTGASSLPGGRWATRGPLGLDELVTLRARSGRLFRWAGGRWTPGQSFPVAVDPVADVIDATVPGLRPGRATWNSVAALGVVDGAGHSFLDGAEPIFDLAFVGGEPPTGWQDSRQGDILAGRLPAADAVAAIDFARVADRVAAAADDTSPGWHTRLYRSALRLGGGIQQATLTAPGGQQVPVGNLYAGPYQPYLVLVSSHLTSPPPLIVYMHGFSQTHTGNSGSFGPPRPGLSPQGLLLGNGGFDLPAITVFPLGRGENTFYIGPAEQDVLDVTTDAIRHFGVDTRRVVLSGVSMGGFGTFRIGIRYPDRWSALVPFIGTGGSAQYEFGAVPTSVLNELFSPTGFPTGDAELLENLADVPIRMINGQIDPLVNNVLVTQDALRLDQLGYDYRSWVLLRRNHEVVPNLSNCVLVEALQHFRDADPARVVLSVEPATFMHAAATGLDLRYDHAYWVSRVQVARGAPKGTVDALSLSRPDRTPASTRTVSAGQNVSKGADLCGPNPAVQTGDAWREMGISLSPGRPVQPPSNAADISLTAVSTAELDLGTSGMRLDTRAPLTLTVTTDGASRLLLAGAWPGPVTVRLDNGPSRRVAPAGDVLMLPVVPGSHVYRLS